MFASPSRNRGQYVVQFNDTARESFHLFVNAPEENLPDKTNPNVLWIEPGEWTIPDGIQLKSGQTLYLSPGAVVHTTVSAQFGSNIKIRGRGMIDGGIWESWKGQDAHLPVNFPILQRRLCRRHHHQQLQRLVLQRV